MTQFLDHAKVDLLKTELGKDVFIELINIYAAELSNLLMQLEDSIGKKALESMIYAHSIRGISSNMGALAIKELAEQIEKLANESKYSEIIILMGDIKLTAHQTIQRLQRLI